MMDHLMVIKEEKRDKNEQMKNYKDNFKSSHKVRSIKQLSNYISNDSVEKSASEIEAIAFFELTELSFDPAEKNNERIKAAIDKAEKSLGGMLGSVSQQAQRDEINGKLVLLRKVKGEVLSGEGKVLPRFSEIADIATKEKLRELRIVFLVKKTVDENGYISREVARLYRRKFGISSQSFDELIRELGMEIENNSPMLNLPKFPNYSEKIYNELNMLRGSKDPNPNGADLTKVYDLYCFAAYLNGESANSDKYRSMPTMDIASLFDEYSKKNVMRNDPLGKLCVSIAAAGKTNVFNNESNRKAYDQFLLYKSPKLVKLFSIINLMLETELRDPKYVNVFMNVIKEVFPDPDIALAIYNYGAGLSSNPVILSNQVRKTETDSIREIV